MVWTIVRFELVGVGYGEAPMLCYSYGCHTATSLNLNVGKKQWGYAAIRSAPEIAQSGW